MSKNIKRHFSVILFNKVINVCNLRNNTHNKLKSILNNKIKWQSHRINILIENIIEDRMVEETISNE